LGGAALASGHQKVTMESALPEGFSIPLRHTHPPPPQRTTPPSATHGLPLPLALRLPPAHSWDLEPPEIFSLTGATLVSTKDP